MKWLMGLFLLASSMLAQAQSIGFGTSSPDASAQLDISSSSKGILIPRMTTAAVHSIADPARGLLVYDTIKNQLLVNMGTATAPDWETIVANSGWSLSGNAGTHPPTEFIGTADAQPLYLGVNSRVAGRIDSATQSVSFGYRAGEAAASNASLVNNTAIGEIALLQSSGIDNTAVGYGSLQSNTTGSQNVAIGVVALGSNTSASGNTAVGFQCATVNKTSGSITALGTETLFNNTSGYNIVAIGGNALNSNTTGYYNTAMGVSSLGYNTTGFSNVAMGGYSMENNIGGYGNTAFGQFSLQTTSNSAYNTAVGEYAGTGRDNGYNNVFIGYNASSNADGYYNDIAIGMETTCSASDQAILGNSSTTSIGGYANWTNFSDGRYKKNIREDVKGLDFIMQLRPITYNLDVTGIRRHLGQSAKDKSTQSAITAREQEVISGFAAQEVEAAATAAGYDFSGVDKPKNADAFYGLRYGDFVVPLVKTLQEQQKMIQDLRKRIEILKAQLKN
jgi:trimeric autotransporter adhesin